MKIPAAAIAAAQRDHIGKLTAVPEHLEVSELWRGRDTRAPAYLRLKHGVPEGSLWPEDSGEGIAPAARNNDSLVVRLRSGERTIVLPGDAEKQVEYTIFAENPAGFPRADVLQWGTVEARTRACRSSWMQ